MAVIDRIKYDGPEDGSTWLIYKYPSEQFVLGSQLIVNSSQEALFFKGGEALDLFGAGTHTLKTGNLPLLNRLVNLPFGGRTPFSAEVYFINKTSRLDMGWGTSVPFDIEDPRYAVPLSIMANGQYGVSVPDARLFIIKLIGAVPGGSLADHSYIGKFFNGHINTKLKSLLHKFMVSRQLSFLDISGHLDELSGDAQAEIRDEFDRFGVEIVNFFIETVKPRPSQFLDEIIAQRTKISATKMELNELGMDFHTQRRQLDIMEKMADNPSTGGLANAGAGLAMGLGVMGQMGTAFSGIGDRMVPGVAAAGVAASGPAVGPNTALSGEKTILCLKCGAKVSGNMKFCGSCGEKMPAGITCGHCGAEVAAGMKFCGECGKPAGNVSCPDCGTENAPGIKFCGECGKKL